VLFVACEWRANLEWTVVNCRQKVEGYRRDRRSETYAQSATRGMCWFNIIVLLVCSTWVIASPSFSQALDVEPVCMGVVHDGQQPEPVQAQLNGFPAGDITW